MDEKFTFNSVEICLTCVVPKTQSACQMMCHGNFETISSIFLLFYILYFQSSQSIQDQYWMENNSAHRRWGT